MGRFVCCCCSCGQLGTHGPKSHSDFGRHAYSAGRGLRTHTPAPPIRSTSCATISRAPSGRHRLVRAWYGRLREALRNCAQQPCTLSSARAGSSCSSTSGCSNHCIIRCGSSRLRSTSSSADDPAEEQHAAAVPDEADDSRACKITRRSKEEGHELRHRILNSLVQCIFFSI